MTTPDTTNPAGTVAQVAQDDVIGTFKTRRNGTYRIGYAYIAATEAQTEMITPQSAQVYEVAITKTGTGATGTLDREPTEVTFDADGMITHQRDEDRHNCGGGQCGSGVLDPDRHQRPVRQCR